MEKKKNPVARPAACRLPSRPKMNEPERSFRRTRVGAPVVPCNAIRPYALPWPGPSPGEIRKYIGISNRGGRGSSLTGKCVRSCLCQPVPGASAVSCSLAVGAGRWERDRWNLGKFRGSRSGSNGWRLLIISQYGSLFFRKAQERRGHII
jgi:hypothetical protein